MSPDKLVYMANQIGKFFASNGHDTAVEGISDHIAKFWEPRMRKQIYAHMATNDGVDLDPLVREGLRVLERKDAAEMAPAK
ncbi:MAG: formate dehydrogenase subunit delta [Methylovirgula sp.]